MTVINVSMHFSRHSRLNKLHFGLLKTVYTYLHDTKVILSLSQWHVSILIDETVTQP